MSAEPQSSIDALFFRVLGSARIGVAVLVLITFWAHAPSLQNHFIWDDDDYVVDNQHLRTAAGLGRIWTDVRATQQYYPLVHTTFWAEYQLWGLAPFHFHFFNLLLHALAAVLLWRCLLRLELPGAFVAACVFALHPVQVESVAWVTERKNVLCGAFYFGAALCLLPVLLPGDGAERPARAGLRYAAGLVLFLFAMLSKTVACVLGPVLLVLVWWKRGAIGRREVALTLPLFGVGAGIGLLTVWLERKHAGAEGPEWAFSLADRCVIAGRSLAFYLQSLIWPGERVFMPPRWAIDGSDALQLAYPIGCALLVALLFALRGRLGRGPLAAALVFGGTLFPALGFFNIYPMRYAFAFDHFQYLAMAAPVALVAAGVARRAARSGSQARALLGFGCVALLALYGTLTWRQSHVYFDAETLWRHTIALNPESWLAHRHLGGITLARGDSAEAAQHFRRAIALKPSDESAYNNLAIASSQLGDHAAAVTALRRAVALRPGHAPTYRNLAIALELAGREHDARGALAEYQRLIGSAQPRAGAVQPASDERRMFEGSAR
jgi:hypothetical protein